MIFEKRFAIYRVISIFLEMLIGFTQPSLFSKYLSQENFSYLLVIYGVAVYFVFMDGGISKIIYSEVREQFVSNKHFQEKIIASLDLFYILSFLIFLVYFLIVLIFGLFHADSVNFSILLLISFGVSLNILFSYLRPIFSSIDRFEEFELIDIFRKLFIFLSLFLIIFDKSLFLTSFFTLISSLIFGLICFRLLGYPLISLFDFKRIIVKSSSSFKEMFARSKDVFVFSLSETSIYNFGFIVLPLMYDSNSVIKFGLWLKVFMGLAVLIRFMTDVNIHRLTKLFFQNSRFAFLKLFDKTLILSIFIVLLSFTLFVLFSKKFFYYWTAGKFEFDFNLYVALFFILLGNGIQHLSGTLLLSIGNQFYFMRNWSLLFLGMIICIYSISFYFQFSLGILLVILQVLYFFGSFIYLGRVYKSVKNI